MHRRSRVSARHSPRRTVAVGSASAAVAALTILLSGCGVASTTEVTPPPTSGSAAMPEPSITEPAAPTLIPEGSAEDNLPLFTAVTESIWASPERESGRAYIDGLAEAGFDRERMQVTHDRSTVDRPAESIQFSVAWGDQECLIGQVGPSTGEPVTAVLAQLAGGRCLIGGTRPIDW